MNVNKRTFRRSEEQIQLFVRKPLYLNFKTRKRMTDFIMVI